MKTLLSIIVISICFCSCYHTDKQTIETLVAVNQSLMETRKVVEGNIQYKRYLLEKYLANDRMKVKPFYDRSIKAINLSDSMVNQLQMLKEKLGEEVGGMIHYSDDSIEYMQNKDAVAKCSSVLLNGADAEAKLLKLALSKYRKRMIELLDWKNEFGYTYSYLKDTIGLNIGLIMPDHKNANGESSSWEENNFGHAPLIADIETLTRLQIDVRNCESKITGYYNSCLSNSSDGIIYFTIYFDKYFGGRRKMVASREQLDSVDRITYYPPMNATFEIQFVEKGKSVVLSSNNIMLTSEMRNEMKKLSKGDKIIIRNVVIKGAYGYELKSDGPTIFVE